MTYDSVIHGDCLQELKKLADNSVHLICTDPPYELGFMGKAWDGTGIAYNVEMLAECLRVLKPGGHLFAFSGTRTYHRMASAIEDAGFEVRDMIEWVYGSGFPKSLNIGKAVDKLQGNEREDAGEYKYGVNRLGKGHDKESGWGMGGDGVRETKGTSEWGGWGTALKPAHEPICMARKPLEKGLTVVENVLKWGTGGIDIDGNRVVAEEIDTSKNRRDTKTTKDLTWVMGKDGGGEIKIGRFPANLIHDNSEEVRECFPETKSVVRISEDKDEQQNTWSLGRTGTTPRGHNDSGNASRFFKSIIYQAKASKSERNKGLDSIVLVDIHRVWNENNTTKEEKLIRLMVTGISPQKVIAESGVQLKNANEWNTCLFGKHLMEKYQEDIKSITKTETNSITTSQILNWLTHLLTNEYTADVKTETENGGNLVENVENSNTLIITINEAMALALGVKDVVLGTQLKISVKEGSNIHSTVKPIALMEYLITLGSRRGDTVLDPFLGSGTTAIAAKQLGRKFIGIEREAEYVEIAKARINVVQASLL